MPRWNFNHDIDYQNIDRSKIEDDELMFYVITIASFIEITSETYADNLISYYDDKSEIVEWLQNSWEKEEIQHGQALKKYISEVWPGFDWQKAYERFLDLYLPLCNIEAFQPTKALEMLARMIVETGTSTFYRTLEKYASSINEPILEKLVHYIYKDEIRHYSYFNKFYNFYNQEENISRKKVLQVMVKRLKEADSEDIEMAFRAIYENLHNGNFKSENYTEFSKKMNTLASKNYPYNMAIKMMLHPLRINKILEVTMISVVRGALKAVNI